MSTPEGPDRRYYDEYGRPYEDPYAEQQQQQPPPDQQQQQQQQQGYYPPQQAQGGDGAWFRDERDGGQQQQQYVGVDGIMSGAEPDHGQYTQQPYYEAQQPPPQAYASPVYGTPQQYAQQAQDQQGQYDQYGRPLAAGHYAQGIQQGGWGDYERPGGWLMDQTLTGIQLGLGGDAGMPSYAEAYNRYESMHRAESIVTVNPVELDLDHNPVPAPSSSPVYRMPGSGAEERMAGIPVGTRAGKKPGKLGGLLGSSAVMAAGTLISRATGFLRSLVIVAAIGTTVFANTYNVANTIPTLLYILVGGGAMNAVFVPQLVRAMRNDDDGGEAYANKLLTLVMVVLASVTVLAVIAAPWIIRLMANSLAQDEADFELAITFARYCLPIIFFMGLHVMFGQILNARERYGPMMWTPVLNNIVIITVFGLYIWVAGTFDTAAPNSESITPDEVRLLGLGTLLGMLVQSLTMIPYLRAARFRFRPRFDWRGSGLGKAAGLAKWSLLFVMANQLGYLAVTQLATAIDSDARKLGIDWGVGFSAYSNALLIWQLPQAVITVSVMTAMLPRMARAAADGDKSSVRDDISSGLRLSAVAMIPCAFIFLALGRDIGGMLFASAGVQSAHWIGYMLMALGLGLIPYSAQYVLMRGFFAYEDTRTPFTNTVWVAAATAALAGLSYLVLPPKWAGVGIAAGYSVAYLIGASLAGTRLRRKIGDLDGKRVTRTYIRLSIAAAIGGAAAFATARMCTGALGEGMLGSSCAVAAGIVVMIIVFFIAATRMRVEEMNAMTGMIKGKLGR